MAALTSACTLLSARLSRDCRMQWKPARVHCWKCQSRLLHLKMLTPLMELWHQSHLLVTCFHRQAVLAGHACARDPGL